MELFCDCCKAAAAAWTVPGALIAENRRTFMILVTKFVKPINFAAKCVGGLKKEMHMPVHVHVMYF